MVYIHAKKVGNTTYYTLRISYRDNGRVVTKDIDNLGTDVTKINIESLEARHKKEIRKSYKTIKKFLEKNYYEEKAKKLKLKKELLLSPTQQIRVRAIREHYTKKFLTSNTLTKKEVFENFLIKFAVNSTRIEGNTITLAEAGRLFEEDVLPKGKTLREVNDLKNTKKVFFELQKKQPRITSALIEEIHDKLLEGIDPRKGYRTSDINILGQPFSPTPGRYVREDIKLLLQWLEEQKKRLHPLVLAALFHHKFENIHPFNDGNGRTGRILMNHILTTQKHPPIIIAQRHRKEYLQAMNEADAAIKKDLRNIEKQYGKLIEFLISELEESYWDTFLL